MKNYHYILLDWDGSLAKTLDIWLFAIRTPLGNRGIHISDKQIAAQCFGRSAESYAELGITDVDAAVTQMDQIARKLLPKVELYPDTLFILDALKKEGKQVALITNSLHDTVHHILNKYHLHDFFDVVITHENTVLHKPHPDPIFKALEKLGGNAENAIMIGDSDRDMSAATNAGVDSVLFYPDTHEKFYDLNELQSFKPTYTIRNLKEVVSIVL